MALSRKKQQSVLVLHNIRSAHNVGAMFRTAEAAGISKIFLTGYTPTPLDKFNKPRADISKSALGAERMIPWESAKTIAPVFKKLKSENYTLVGIEQSSTSVDYKKVHVKTNIAFVMGNEVLGISPALLKKCDVVAEIPMKGRKESLNVSVAFGIAIFRILNV